MSSGAEYTPLSPLLNDGGSITSATTTPPPTAEPATSIDTAMLGDTPIMRRAEYGSLRVVKSAFHFCDSDCRYSTLASTQSLHLRAVS